jgi:hypothetical protein
MVISTSASGRTVGVDRGRTTAAGGMQSIEQGLDLLERMADAGGEVTLTELSYDDATA